MKRLVDCRLVSLLKSCSCLATVCPRSCHRGRDIPAHSDTRGPGGRSPSQLPQERHQLLSSPRRSACVSRIRLKNSTVSSSVSSRPSWKYGGDSLMPRSGNVLIGPCLVATRPLIVCVL